MTASVLETPPLPSTTAAPSERTARTIVREYDHCDSLRHRRREWNALALPMLGNSHFHSFDWLETYWRHHSPGQRLRILTIESQFDDGSTRLAGVLPLVVRRESTRLGSVRTLTYPLHGWGTLYGPIGPDPRTTLHAGMTHLARTKRDFDLLELRWIEERLAAPTETALSQNGFAVERGVWFQAHQVDLAAGWDAYWASRTSHWRTNVRANEKKLSKAGRVEFVRHRTSAHDDDPRWDLYEECVEVAAKSWQGGRDDGTTLSHTQVSEYLRDAHATAARCGAADINLLRVDGRAVAFAYNYGAPGYVYGVRAGYDPAFRECGVGSVLMRRMLEDSAQRQDGLLDLGPDHAAAKLPWANRTIDCLKYSHYPRTSWKAWGLWLKRRLANRGSRT
ncbi:MAG: GNAT family N-acetyltransferase [Pirellulales bacterium]